MAWPAVVGAISSAISSASSVTGGIKGGKSAGEAAREEARLEGIVTSAKLLDLIKEERALRGQTIARVVGSGVKVGAGSPLQILAEQAREFSRERLTVAQAGAARTAAGLQRGRMAAESARYQGSAQGFSSLGSAFSLWGSGKAYLGSQPGKG